MNTTTLLSTPRRAAKPLPTLAALALALLSAGCVNLAPDYQRPAAPVPAGWADAVPASAATAPGAGASAPMAGAAAQLDWSAFFTDERLRRLIALTLAQNRDLRIATLNIERARALYHVEQAAQWPGLDGNMSGSRSKSSAGTSSSGQSSVGNSVSASVSLPSYELDFFSRVRNLSEAALQTFLATEASQRSTQIALVADTATAWLTLAANQQQLTLAQQTLKTRQESYDLTRRAHALGGESGLTLAQTQTTVDAARASVASYVALVQQSRNALNLLAGATVPLELLPGAAEPRSVAVLLDVPAELPSSVLLQRPDVIAAEHALQGSNAQIGAARAAFFPRITLTGSAGVASHSLSQLFDGGNGTWSFGPSISLPIFDGGANKANLQVAKVDRDLQLATYEHTVQVAFREVADALAARSTLGDQLAAQSSLVQASQKTLTLSQALHERGAASFLDVLDAQRSLYSAQQTLIQLQLAEQSNRLTLYRVLGGGWRGGAVVGAF